jgi:hypothetical protein
VGEEDRENRNRVYTQGERPKAGALGCYPLRPERERESERRAKGQERGTEGRREKEISGEASTERTH